MQDWQGQAFRQLDVAHIIDEESVKSAPILSVVARFQSDFVPMHKYFSEKYLHEIINISILFFSVLEVFDMARFTN